MADRSARLRSRRTAPPEVTATVEPGRDLTDEQSVTVRGEHLSFREEAFAYLCAEGSGAVGTRCDLDRMARTVPDQQGRATSSLTVRSAFTTPLGGTVDCRPRPGRRASSCWGGASIPTGPPGPRPHLLRRGTRHDHHHHGIDLDDDDAAGSGLATTGHAGPRPGGYAG